MFILDNRRINIYSPYTAPDGTQYGNLLDPAVREAVGVVELAEPAQPTDYSEDSYFRTEQDEAPYVVYTPKPAEMVTAAKRAKALAEIARLEEIQLRESLRMQRERELEAAEKYALDNLGLSPDQLYAAASQPGAPIAFLTYKRMKDIDDAVKAQREKL